jgi:hypothetical protein
MKDYQKEVWDKFSAYRVEPTYPTYPPYHQGPYLEDYFIQKFLDEDPETERIFIPVSWTTIYIQNSTAGLQGALNSLDRSQKYFTVAQHDDAIREMLPPDTGQFNAGGNGGGIPIPLICSPIPEAMIPRHLPSILGSFVGSVTHPHRANLLVSLQNNPDFVFRTKRWTEGVSNIELQTFIEITSRSIFCLCPRGYGKSSFRMYESFQLGAIPVYVHDEGEPWIPFTNELNWNEFAVLIPHTKIHEVNLILQDLAQDKERIASMQQRGKEVWKSHFSMDGLYNQVIKRL